MERVASLPGVEAVALASPDALRRRNRIETDHPWPAGPHRATPGNRLQAGIRTVSPTYADVVRLRFADWPLLYRSRRSRRSARRGGQRISSRARPFGGKPAVGQRLALPTFPFPGARRDDDGSDAQT